MPRPAGPHTRNPQPAALYRGSKRRVAALSAFGRLPIDFWLFVAIAAAMLGISIGLLYVSLTA